MATGFEWTELFLKYQKQVFTTILVLIPLLGWNVYGNFDKSATIAAKEKEMDETIVQMTNIAEHFYITTTPNKTKSKAPVIQCTAACIKIINEQINAHKKGRLH